MYRLVTFSQGQELQFRAKLSDHVMRRSAFGFSSTTAHLCISLSQRVVRITRTPSFNETESCDSCVRG
jgi:hypothetical protein